MAAAATRVDSRQAAAAATRQAAVIRQEVAVIRLDRLAAGTHQSGADSEEAQASVEAMEVARDTNKSRSDINLQKARTLTKLCCTQSRRS